MTTANVLTWTWLFLGILRTESSSSSSLRSLESTNTSSLPCSICPNPQDSITLPNASIPVFGTCNELEAVVSLFTRDSDTCKLIQSVSSLCGCPVSETSCFLCDGNYDVPNIDLSRPVPYLLNAPGINITCEIAQAYLHSISSSDPACAVTKSLVGPYCSCPGAASGAGISGGNGNPCSICQTSNLIVANRSLDLGLNLSFLQTCGDLENIANTYWQNGSQTCQAVQTIGPFCGCLPANTTESSRCSFCANFSDYSFPSKTLPFLQNQFSLAGMAPTCGLIEAALHSVSSDDAVCSNVRMFASYCGCPPIQHYCSYCPKTFDIMTKPDRVIPAFSRFSGLSDLTCRDILWTQYQLPDSSPACWMITGKSFQCGCNNGEYDYLGSNSDAKKNKFVWIPRCSAFLSICGSLYILVDVYRNHRKKLDLYHELIASMSLFDFLGSTATAFTTLPIPVYDHDGLPTGIHGARGNDATCKLQGFFVQLGYTGIFYNFGLSIFFVLVVNYSYRDRDLKRVRRYFHFASVVGFALAFAGIPYYDNFIWLCQIPSIPIIETYRYMFIFVFYPIVIAILGSGVAISLVFLKVRRVSQASKRWMFSNRGGTGGGVGGKMARKVFWQAFFFLLALYGTWPLLMIAEFSSKNVIKIYDYHWVWQITLALAPLQGFFNFFVYTRPKIMSYLRQLLRKRERQVTTTPKPRNMSWARKGMRLPLRVEMPSETSSNDEKKGRPREVPPMLDDDDDDDHSEECNIDIPPRNHSIDVTESTGMSLARRRMQMSSSGNGSQAETIASIGKSPTSDVDACDDSDIPTTHDSGHIRPSIENDEEAESNCDGTA